MLFVIYKCWMLLWMWIHTLNVRYSISMLNENTNVKNLDVEC